jgi:hypothetical protein
VNLLKPTDTNQFPNSYARFGAGGGGGETDVIRMMGLTGCYDNLNSVAPQRNQ